MTRKQKIAYIRERIAREDIVLDLSGMENPDRNTISLLKIVADPSLLTDPIWRIGNLYTCQYKLNDKGETHGPFSPKPAQCLLLYDVFVLGLRKQVVLKARQMGFSTLIAIIGLDHVLFNPNTQFNIVSIDLVSAEDMLSKKVRFALEYFPQELKDALVPKPDKDLPDNTSAMMFGKIWGIKSKTSHRSDTSHVLHVSEWGALANDDKKKSREIKTGTLPTANFEGAMVFLESTARGGEKGDYYEKWIEARSVKEDQRTWKDYSAFFAPWFLDPDYRLSCKEDWVTDETRLYFAGIRSWYLDEGWDEEDLEFTDEQMYWWQREKADQGQNMYEEYPSTWREAFMVPIDGQVYADAMIQAKNEGRIINFAHDPFRPVFAVVDPGWSMNTAVGIVQETASGLDFLWYHEAKQEPPQYFVNKVIEAGFTPIKWILPWDAFQGDPSTNVAAKFRKAGAVSLDKINRTTKKARVEAGKALIRHCRFVADTTIPLVNSMMAYSWPSDRKEPIHDDSSDGADMYGYSCEARQAGKFRSHSMSNLQARDYVRQKEKKQAKGEMYRYGRC